ncbi:MAG: HU family DNA-binding protein [Candidatus Delongbacteria bacterium]|nr:HU family DNA-binding protein [Candidatus Delongbacteria bacterium]
MTKADLIAAVAGKCEMTKKDSAAFLEAVMETITKSLSKGEGITLVGFGSFSVAKRAERKGRNPQTGKEIKIKAKKVAVFKPGKDLKEAVK